MSRKRSIGHGEVGKILRHSFGSHKILEEYPYKKMLAEYYKRNKHIVPDNSLLAKAQNLRADWVILDLKIAIEVQGDQHYAPVRFAGDMNCAELMYFDQRLRDHMKREIASESNWTLVEIPYTKEYTPNQDDILSMIYDEILKIY
jgi:hypothetical protein